VSGLSYAGIAIAYLLSQGVEQGLGISLTLLGLAIVVLGLSAGWRSLRKAVLPVLPLGRLRELIPPADLARIP
jgi:predicted RND superfamily exporter protein